MPTTWMLVLLTGPAPAAETPRLDALKERFQTEALTLGAVARIQGRFEPEPEDGEASGMRVQTARLRMTGRLDQGLRYGLLADLAVPTLLDARVGWRHSSGAIGVWAGRFKVPVSAEFILPLERIDFANRSRVVSQLAPNRDVGAQLDGEAGVWRWEAGMFNGNRAPGGNDGDNVLVAGRTGVHIPVGEGSFDLYANGAWGQDTAAPWAGVTAFEGTRWVAGGDARLEVAPLLLAAEVLAARGEPAVGPTFEPAGGTVTAGVDALPGTRALVRLDSYTPDGLDALDHRVVLGATWWPVAPAELQLNWIVPWEGGTGDHELQAIAQIAF